MKKIVFQRFAASLALILALSAFAATPKTAKTTTVITTTKPRIQDDFYGAVNYDWLQNAKISQYEISAGGFADISETVENDLMKDLDEGVKKGLDKQDSPKGQMYRFYKIANDNNRRNQQGAKPAFQILNRVEKLKSLDDINKNIIELYENNITMPFGFSVSADMKNASKYVVYIGGARTILPEKSFYSKENENGKKLLSVFSSSLEEVLVLLGKTKAQAAEIARDTIRMDARIAPYKRTTQEANMMSKVYNRVSRENFIKFYNTTFDSLSVMDKLLPSKPKSVIVSNIDYYKNLKEIYEQVDFSVVRNWMYGMTAFQIAPYLSNDIRNSANRYSQAITGITKNPDDKRVAFEATDQLFSEVVGQIYAEKYFSKQAKQDVEKMVNNIILVYEKRLKQNSWLSEKTKQQAIVKLKAMKVKIGYPEKISPMYSLIRVDESKSLIENVIAIAKIQQKDNYARFEKNVDRNEWPIDPHEVNAMYSTQSNDITFPAAILQAPFYSTKQSESQNYGGIGTIIAHEISHAFDTSGSQYDEFGNRGQWWTKADYEEFSKRAQAMVNQFNAETMNGKPIDGLLTISENVADSGGLSCALEIVQSLPNGDVKAFFTNWAVIWREIYRPEIEELMFAIDVHAPNKTRTNVTPTNFEAFFEAFEIKEGDEMWRAPEDRVTVW